MGTGYRNKPEKTIETSQNTPKSRTSPSHAEGATDDATWVRTGDLGAYHDGELYITGRTRTWSSSMAATTRRIWSTRGGHQGGAHRFVGGVLGACQPAARRGVRRRPRRVQTQSRRPPSKFVIVAERAPVSHKMEIEQVADAIRPPSRCATV